jgi:Flp pilus assembly CpaF family ATPase
MIINYFFCLSFSSASCLKSSKSNTVVLSGLTGSGKTTLFYQVTALFCLTREEEGIII